MKLRTGKNVPFLNKNIPKRKYTKSYKYKTPISKEAEDDLASSFANISLCDKKKPTTKDADTPTKHRLANRKSLMFEDNSSSDEEEPIAKYDLSALPFDETENEREVDHVEIVLFALSSDDEEQGADDEPEIIHVSSEQDPIVFTANDDIGSVTSDDEISDAVPVSDSDEDESDDDSDDSKVERIFRASTPSGQIGRVLSFLQNSMQTLELSQWWNIFTEDTEKKTSISFPNILRMRISFLAPFHCNTEKMWKSRPQSIASFALN